MISNDSESLFISLLAICMSSLVKCHFICPLLSKRYHIYLFISYFSFFRVAPVTNENSQSRGQTGATPVSLHHSHSHKGSELILQPTPQCEARLDPLTHRARPGIKPTFSWILIGFLIH